MQEGVSQGLEERRAGLLLLLRGGVPMGCEKLTPEHVFLASRRVGRAAPGAPLEDCPTEGAGRRAAPRQTTGRPRQPGKARTGAQRWWRSTCPGSEAVRLDRYGREGCTAPFGRRRRWSGRRRGCRTGPQRARGGAHDAPPPGRKEPQEADASPPCAGEIQIARVGRTRPEHKAAGGCLGR